MVALLHVVERDPRLDAVAWENGARTPTISKANMSWLRSVTRRYNDQIGVQQNRMSFDRVGKNVNSLAAEASVIHVGPIARAELIGLLQFLEFKGTGLAALARLSAGDASVALKILSTLERQGHGKDDISRDAVETAFHDLRLGAERRDAA